MDAIPPRDPAQQHDAYALGSSLGASPASSGPSEGTPTTAAAASAAPVGHSAPATNATTTTSTTAAYSPHNITTNGGEGEPYHLRENLQQQQQQQQPHQQQPPQQPLLLQFQLQQQPGLGQPDLYEGNWTGGVTADGRRVWVAAGPGPGGGVPGGGGGRVVVPYVPSIRRSRQYLYYYDPSHGYYDSSLPSSASHTSAAPSASSPATTPRSPSIAINASTTSSSSITNTSVGADRMHAASGGGAAVSPPAWYQQTGGTIPAKLNTGTDNAAPIISISTASVSAMMPALPATAPSTVNSMMNSAALSSFSVMTPGSSDLPLASNLTRGTEPEQLRAAPTSGVPSYPQALPHVNTTSPLGSNNPSLVSTTNTYPSVQPLVPSSAAPTATLDGSLRQHRGKAHLLSQFASPKLSSTPPTPSDHDGFSSSEESDESSSDSEGDAPIWAPHYFPGSTAPQIPVSATQIPVLPSPTTEVLSLPLPQHSVSYVTTPTSDMSTPRLSTMPLAVPSLPTSAVSPPSSAQPLMWQHFAEPCYWNERFQDLISRINQIRESDTRQTRVQEETLLASFKELRDLAHDFVYAARSYGKIIISEKFLPFKQKTITPASVGGVAGGTKYKAKAAAHDLTGTTAMFNTAVPGLHFPIMVRISYLGWTITAMPLLPISKQTLAYGSCNAGHLVKNSNHDLAEKIQLAAKRLNLKGHTAGRNREYIYGPTDIEGHVGYDGRFYILDLARLFTPETPDGRTKGSNLYRLLRPEFVRSNPRSLSSDALSGFNRFDTSGSASDLEARQATDRLRKEIIPCFAEWLETRSGFDKLSSTDPRTLTLHKLMHRFGCNVRYCGLVWKLVRSESMKEILVTEMAARAIKNEMQARLRRKMAEERRLSETPHKHLIIEFLNLALFRSRRIIWLIQGSPGGERAYDRHFDSWYTRPSQREFEEQILAFWKTTIHPKMSSMFSVYNADWMYSLSLASPLGIYIRLRDMMGLVLSEEAVDKCICRLGGILHPRDLLHMPSKVKYMDIVAITEANILALMTHHEEKTTIQWQRSAIKLFTSVLDSNPIDHWTRYDLGQVQLKLALRTNGSEAEQLLDEAATNFVAVQEFLSSSRHEAALQTVNAARSFTKLVPRGEIITNSTVLALQCNQDLIYVGCMDSPYLSVFSQLTGKLVCNFIGHVGAVLCLQTVGDLLVSGGFDKSVKIWNLSTSTLLHELYGHSAAIRCMKHIPHNPSQVATGSFDSTVQVWDVVVGAHVGTLMGHADIVYSLLPLSNGLLVSGSGDRTIRIWDLTTWTCKNILTGHTERVSCLAAVTGTQHFVSGSGDHTLRIWDSSNGDCVCLLQGHTDTVTCISIDQGILASGSSDHTWRLWDIEFTKACTKVVEGSDAEINAVSLQALSSPPTTCGVALITSGGDARVRMWHLHPPNHTKREDDDVCAVCGCDCDGEVDGGKGLGLLGGSGANGGGSNGQTALDESPASQLNPQPITGNGNGSGSGNNGSGSAEYTGWLQNMVGWCLPSRVVKMLPQFGFYSHSPDLADPQNENENDGSDPPKDTQNPTKQEQS
ncbi:Histidine kinase A [Pelomyxa schiedti]|nr:Histidine kinase A [Pelomyxa schiedti]